MVTILQKDFDAFLRLKTNVLGVSKENISIFYKFFSEQNKRTFTVCCHVK